MKAVSAAVWASLLGGSLVSHATLQQAVSIDVQTLTYASRDGKDLLLDLYRPAGSARPLPVILFLHGGGWSGGTRTTGPDFKRFFAQDGFAMASIEYRLTPSVTFPANVEDVKTAVRWLRANAGQLALDTDHIAIWGTSAGGHLAAVAALSPRGMFEGADNLDQSSAVQCVLDAYGPVMFTAMDAQTENEKATRQPLAPSLVNAPPMVGGVVTTNAAENRGTAAPPAGARAGGPGAMPHDAPNSPESRLVGAPIQTVPDRVKAASPLTYVAAGAPPFLLMHGLADNSVPHHQSVMLYEALAAAGNTATLRLIDGLPHTFFNRTNLDELAGPFRMDVREPLAGKPEQTRVDRQGVFDVARAFFQQHLQAGAAVAVKLQEGSEDVDTPGAAERAAWMTAPGAQLRPYDRAITNAK